MTLPEVLAALLEVRLEEFPSPAAARAATELVRLCGGARPEPVPVAVEVVRVVSRRPRGEYRKRKGVA